MQSLPTSRVCTPALENSLPDVALTRGRVLFVSADSDLRAVAARVLQRAGYRVSAVAHSGHALLHCRTSVIDVLIVELSGPDISGPALAEQVRRHCPSVSAIYLGNPGCPEAVENLLVRPFTRDDLLERIHTVTAGATAA